MESTHSLQVGDVVQLNPDTVKNKAFAACMLTVTEVKAFGCVGYVQPLGTRMCSHGDRIISGQAYYRAEWAEMEYVGKSVWQVP